MTPSNQPLATFQRTASGLTAIVLLLLLGVPFALAGINIALTRLGEGLGLVAFSMLFNLPAILIAMKYAKVRRAREVVAIYPDRVERRASGQDESMPLPDLVRIEAKVTTFTNTGNRYHSYRLTFRGRAPLELETDTHQGVDGETGRLLAELSGVPVQAWA